MTSAAIFLTDEDGQSPEAEATPDDNGLVMPESDSERHEAEDERQQPIKATEHKNTKLGWYAVHTYSGFEKSVKKTLTFLSETQQELEGKIARIYVPTEQIRTRRADGRETKRERPLFPGYVFLLMELTPDVVRLCTEAPKVIGFVKSGDEPQRFTAEEIAAIERGKEERQQAGVREVPFNVGDRVKIVEGLFAPFTGAVEDVSADRKRLKVTVGIFGRPIPVELAFDQVELTDEEE
ncbi:MAG: transcription termination/antitermination factor NusG [Candidatus Coatesbacteria bacterium]|nr:transcription termination/antitermination factor NusG [Candidatus Coatesbacteria bacterium]